MLNEKKNTQGWRNIGGIDKYYRSLWEANYARYLNYLKEKGYIKDWRHEAKTFWFDKIKRGTRSYLPDFEIVNKNNTVEYVEVKGWYDTKSLTKIKRLQRYYPDIKLTLIDGKWFKKNNANLRILISDWEVGENNLNKPTQQIK